MQPIRTTSCLILTKNMGLNVAAACGAIANLYKESGLLSNNVENTFTNKTGMTDEEYTSKVNSGEYTKDQFCNDAAGYGLCQWTYWSRKEALYDFAVSYCKEKGLKFDIGNLDMQLEYFKKKYRVTVQFKAHLAKCQILKLEHSLAHGLCVRTLKDQPGLILL